eukprot:759768-Hanusia_phi.AAC.1
MTLLPELGVWQLSDTNTPPAQPIRYHDTPSPGPVGCDTELRCTEPARTDRTNFQVQESYPHPCSPSSSPDSPPLLRLPAS